MKNILLIILFCLVSLAAFQGCDMVDGMDTQPTTQGDCGDDPPGGGGGGGGDPPPCP